MLSGNNTSASYTYDVDGLRTSKTINGVKYEYYYVGDRLQYEKYGDIELWFFPDLDQLEPVTVIVTVAGGVIIGSGESWARKYFLN